MTPRSLNSLKWVLIAGTAFLLTLAATVTFYLLAHQSQIPSSIYYVILFPLGIAAAAFLFGAMRSHAKYVGKTSYGDLELGGPVVAFALVLVGGFFFSRGATFPLVVRLQGPAGPSDMIRRGSVTIDLAGDRRTKEIQEGEVIFNGVPKDLEGKNVGLIPDVDGLELRETDPIRIPASHLIELKLARRSYATMVRGVITYRDNRPVSAAFVSFDGGLVTAQTDSAGGFAVRIPLRPGSLVPLSVRVRNRIVYDDNVTIAESPSLRIRVERNR